MDIETKFWFITGTIESGEQPARDYKTGERVTLTNQRLFLKSGDYFSVYLVDVVPDADIKEARTKTACKFNIMDSDGRLSQYVCSMYTGGKAIHAHLSALMEGEGTSREEVEEYLQEIRDCYSGEDKKRAAKIEELMKFGYTREQAEESVERCREWWEEEHKRNLSAPCMVSVVEG